MFFVSILLISSLSHSLKTSYISLEDPPNWICQQTGKSWLCRSRNKLETKEIFLTVRAKLVSKKDNLPNYFEVLRQPKPYTDNNGKSHFSTVYSTKIQKVDNHKWVRSLHLNGVVKKFFTEFLVTVVGDVSISLELTYHQSRHEKYKNHMDMFISTLKLLENVATKQKTLSDNKPSTKPTFTIPQADKKIQDPKSDSKLLYIIIGLIGILTIFGLLKLK